MGPNVGLKPIRSTFRLVQPPLLNPPKQGEKAGVLAAFEDHTKPIQTGRSAQPPAPPEQDVWPMHPLHGLGSIPTRCTACYSLWPPPDASRTTEGVWHEPTAPRLHISTVAIAQTGSDGHNPSITALPMHRCNLAVAAAPCTLYSPLLSSTLLHRAEVLGAEVPNASLWLKLSSQPSHNVRTKGSRWGSSAEKAVNVRSGCCPRHVPAMAARRASSCWNRPHKFERRISFRI
jgi:hypothetical protein